MLSMGSGRIVTRRPITSRAAPVIHQATLMWISEQ
jgi:hypothetical protein